MPHRYPVQSLQKMCFAGLAELIRNFSTNAILLSSANKTAHFIKEALKYFKIPRSFALQIMLEVTLQSVVTTEIVVLFSELGFHELNLAGLNCDVDLGLALELMSVETKEKIQFLKITGAIEHVPLCVLIHLPSALPNLKTAILPYTACNDVVLANFAKNCPNLSHLDLTRCPITDKGILNLYIGISHRSCIDYISILGTKVTPTGIKNAIMNLPLLRTINYSHLADVLFLLKEEKQSVYSLETLDLFSSLPNFQLPRYMAIADHEQNSNLEISIFDIIGNLFPVLTNLSICLVDNIALSFEPLKNLKHLLNLSIIAECPQQQNFFQINQIFELIGHQLHELSLVNFNTVSVHGLQMCKQLKRLLLHNINTVLEETMINFPALEILQLGNMPENLIRYLMLGHCKQLKKLQLYKCEKFPMNLWRKTDWHNLHHLAFSHFSCITYQQFLFILYNSNCPLEEVNFDHCLPLLCKMNEIESLIIQNNFNVTIKRYDISSIFGEVKESFLQTALLMPRKRNPSTLQKLCLQPLVEMLWDWWLRSKNKQVAEVEKIYQYYRLPGIFTEEILSILDENHEVYTGHVCLLIKLGMRRFTLTKLYYVEFEIIMKQPSVVLKNLIYLDLSRNRLPLPLLIKLPKEIPQIQVLRLQFTQSTDEVLAAIALQCPELKELDLSFCPITDGGIQNFCMKSKCLQILTSLCIIETKISAKGAEYILKHIPMLNDLEFHNAIELFVAMHSKDLHAGRLEKIGKYNLQLIRFNLEPKSHRMHRPKYDRDHDYQIISEAFHIAVITCPKLKHAIINEWDPNQSGSLHLLTHCEHLTCLEFNVKDYPTLSMEDIQPILEGRGHQLKELTLKHILNVDVVILCTFCSYLEILSLDDNSYIHSDQSPITQYHCLHDLTLIGNIPDDMLYMILISCPNTRSITIDHSYNFTHELLQSIILVNSFPRLEILDFSECDRFTVDGLRLFIQCENNLYEIWIENCRISYTQYVQLLQWIAKFQPTTDISFEFKSRIW